MRITFTLRRGNCPPIKINGVTVFTIQLPKLCISNSGQHRCISLLGLSGLTADIGGPPQSRRRLMMTKPESILLYGSEMWAGALMVDCRLRILSSVQRTAALRVESADMIVSKAAILVKTGTILTEI